MTSVVPQNFDAAFVAEIEKLIKRVKVIANYLDPYDEHATNEGPVLRDLNDWMNEVEVKFNTNELKELLPYNFFDSRKMKLPRQPGGSVITFGNTEHLQKLITFRKELLQKIDSQISALVIIKDNYKMLQKPI